MILSHEHRFIFVKTRKTAGTSLEIALSRHCGESDVITPITPEDERLRRGLGVRGPQNHRPGRIMSALRRLRGLRRSWVNHMPAGEIRARVGRAVWDTYFTFCFERNPWDKVVSAYFYYARAETVEGLGAFVESPELARHSDFPAYTIDGELAVDFVGRYEDLDRDVTHVTRVLGLPPLGPLPRAKAGFRKDRRSYRELLTPHQADVIATAFAREIDAFGYTF